MLNPGSTVRLRFKVQVNPGTAGLYATNQANAFATGQPPTPSNLYQVPIIAPPGVVSITKTSSGGGTVVPGQVVTYTVVVANNSATTQTNVAIADALPPGTTFVPGSASVVTSSPVFRSTEYYVPPGVFTTATFTQTLNQDLATNYFVMVQGSSTNAATAPNTNYIRLNGDPYGSGSAGTLTGIADIVAAPAGPNNVLRFVRDTATGSWTGVITVVECLTACATAGFQLLDAGNVTQAANTLTNTANSDVAWTGAELPRIMIMGGFQGAGCNTASAVAGDAKVCHSRWTPSGTQTLTWLRNAAGTSTTPNILAADNTVMVIRWGSEWTVQLKRINAANGGADVDATTEYNVSTALAPPAGVARANTWVWGTGFTTNNEQRNAAEGVILTLGDGVNTNALETVLSAGQWNNGQTIDFDVYAMTHPSLLVDHRFKASDATNDPTTLVFDQTTTAGAGARFGLSYQANSLNDNNYPQSMFSSTYLSPAQIRLQRTQAAGTFAAWTQGVNFSAISTTTAPVAPGHAPPNLVVAGDGFTIAPAGSLTLTYQVTVNAVPGVPTIINTATYTSTQVSFPGLSATVTDIVAIPKVRVEPNNAGFAAVPATVAGTPILFTQGVTNLGNTADAFTINLKSELANWKVELIDPATGSVIATDTNGDGVWDGGISISTGTLAVNETKSYTIRATVPFGTVAGTENTVELTAVSALSALAKDVGTDEVTVLPAATFGPVVLLPDHSGIVDPGGTIAYTHRLFNNTGASEAFDLRVDTTIQPPNAWTATVYADTNGDGVFSPGDLALPASPTTGFVSSAVIPNGGSQILFVVTTAPGAAMAGVDDVAHLTARSRTNPVLVDAVTDTTTILAATTHDLAGGGTRMASAGDMTFFPGTLYNLKSTADRFDFNITASSLFGVDGLLHPTELWVDTNADGLPDTKIAVDTDGDGTWDQLCNGVNLPCSAATFNNNGNGLPDFSVPANGQVAYELRRQISPSQSIWKEYATVTATSFNDPTQKDSITAQWIIAALSRASIRGLRVDASGVVEFVTGTQQNTAFFNLYETADRSFDGARTLLNASPIISPAPDSLLPILYRTETSPVKGPYIVIEETETNGNTLTYGPYSIVNTRLSRGLERVEAQMDRFAVPAGRVRVSRQSLDRIPGAAVHRIRNRTILGRPASSTGSLLLDVNGEGAISIPVSVLQGSGFPNPAPPAVRTLLTRNGVSVPLSISDVSGVSSLSFTAESESTDYTEDSSYILSWPRSGAVPAPTVALSRSSDLDRPGFTRIERNSIYAVTVPAGSDPWQWDLLSGDGTTWPYAGYDPALGTFDLPQLAATSPGTTQVKVRLVGVSEFRHVVSARINGFDVGSVTFDGRTAALIEGVIPQSILTKTGNQLTLVYSAQKSDGSSAPSGYAYLDYVDVGIPVTPLASTASLVAIRAYDAGLPRLNGVKYVILTHPLFRAQADRLAALKTAEGLKATVIDINAAYDRYSGGVPEPRAIAAALREVAATSGVLKYAVLFGDDSLDPRNYLGGDTVSYLPSIMGRDGQSRIPNENAYADLNDDGSPDIAIGRLPVTTIEEATAVVDKIENQTATLAASGNVHVFVSDNSREIDAKFSGNALAMSQLLPSTTTSVIADVGSAGVGLARSAMFGAWRQGSTMTHYFGHGGPEIWTDEALFSVDDIPDLGSMSPMVLLAWACQSQFYQNYYGPSVNEALLLAPGAGALASFGPVGISSPEHQKSIYERVYATLYGEGDSLGEIIRKAKVAALAADPKNQDVVDGFVFFGDPSLHLPEPPAVPAPSVRPRKNK
ncbi:MAG: C25 family cysteine peptidase [Vicinamibacteria bacterium]